MPSPGAHNVPIEGKDRDPFRNKVAKFLKRNESGMWKRELVTTPRNVSECLIALAEVSELECKLPEDMARWKQEQLCVAREFAMLRARNRPALDDVTNMLDVSEQLRLNIAEAYFDLGGICRARDLLSEQRQDYLSAHGLSWFRLRRQQSAAFLIVFPFQK